MAERRTRNAQVPGSIPGSGCKIKKFFTTESDGKGYNTIHYNPDMIIAIGYRVQSQIATRFRRWAGRLGSRWH